MIWNQCYKEQHVCEETLVRMRSSNDDLVHSLAEKKTYHKDPDAGETVEVLVRDRFLNSTHRLTIPAKEKVDSHVNQRCVRGRMQKVLPEQCSCQRRLSSQKEIDNIRCRLDHRVDKAIVEAWRRRCWCKGNEE